MKVAVIGGGAAGFFAALSAAEHHPKASITIFEQSGKLLSKVKISGGGRCNVTNGTTSIAQLAKAYPRGSKQLKRAFRTFSTTHTMQWFEERGVALMTQEDNCVFPVSQSSQTVIDCFLAEAKRHGIRIQAKAGVVGLERLPEDRWRLHFRKGQPAPQAFDRVIVATGGSPKRRGLAWLEQMPHAIEDPVPSLFTFNMPEESVTELMGVVVEKVLVDIQGTKLQSDGPLLITHWGMSGPAILKLSAFGARTLSELGYQFKVQVNWANERNAQAVAGHLRDLAEAHPQKAAANLRPYELPKRLWHFLLEKAVLPADKKWGELGKKGINKLTHLLTNDVYAVRGKTTFKEEFVTCGGISLQDIDFKSMQSRTCPNLYFAGEVLDIDGITGGYNFQSAWTTGYIAGRLEG